MTVGEYRKKKYMTGGEYRNNKYMTGGEYRNKKCMTFNDLTCHNDERDLGQLNLLVVNVLDNVNNNKCSDRCMER